MFQSHDPSAEFHAVARAVSGGPVYFTDEPGRERPEILRRLTLSDGRLLMADGPAQVTRDLLLTDTSLEAVPLKVFNRVTRPGLSAGVVAAFNVNKSAPRVAGPLYAGDAGGPPLGGDLSSPLPKVAVYQRSRSLVTLLDPTSPPIAVDLSENGFDLYTFAPVEGGVAVFGLLDKYLSPAAVVSVGRRGVETVVRLREGGDFGGIGLTQVAAE